MKFEFSILALLLTMGLAIKADTTNELSVTNGAVAETNQVSDADAKTEADSEPATEETPAPSSGPLTESSFRIITERNIFNGNRSGGTVRSSNSRRAPRVEWFTLVGTMAYEKGAFAFFEGSSSGFTKALNVNGLIVGYKVVDIYANAVKLEADGKEIELSIGSQMRREDEGTWHVSESHEGNGESNGIASSSYSNRDRENSGRATRGNRNDSTRGRRDNGGERSFSSDRQSSSSNGGAAATGDASEVLKRLMERREKEAK